MKGGDISEIILLIVQAVRDYPLYGLNDTEKYFIEIQSLLGQDDITDESVQKYLEDNPNKSHEKNIWVVSSLTSLLEAFSLMKLYIIDFSSVREIINKA